MLVAPISGVILPPNESFQCGNAKRAPELDIDGKEFTSIVIGGTCDGKTNASFRSAQLVHWHIYALSDDDVPRLDMFPDNLVVPKVARDGHTLEFEFSEDIPWPSVGKMAQAAVNLYVPKRKLKHIILAGINDNIEIINTVGASSSSGITGPETAMKIIHSGISSTLYVKSASGIQYTGSGVNTTALLEASKAGSDELELSGVNNLVKLKLVDDGMDRGVDEAELQIEVSGVKDTIYLEGDYSRIETSGVRNHFYINSHHDGTGNCHDFHSSGILNVCSTTKQEVSVPKLPCLSSTKVVNIHCGHSSESNVLPSIWIILAIVMLAIVAVVAVTCCCVACIWGTIQGCCKCCIQCCTLCCCTPRHRTEVVEQHEVHHHHHHVLPATQAENLDPNVQTVDLTQPLLPADGDQIPSAEVVALPLSQNADASATNDDTPHPEVAQRRKRSDFMVWLLGLAILPMLSSSANAYMAEAYFVGPHRLEARICRREFIPKATCLRPISVFNNEGFAPSPAQRMTSKVLFQQMPHHAPTELMPRDDYDENYPGQDQDGVTYKMNLELGALAKSCSQWDKRVAQEAYDLLHTLECADTVGYNSVLKVCAKTSSPSNKQAANLADRILQEMEDLNYEQTEEQIQWFEREDEGELTEEDHELGPPQVFVKPNVKSYSTVMDAYAKQNSYSGAVRAQEVLERLQAKFDETGDYAMMPNSISFNTVLSAWAKSGWQEEGAEHCEMLLNEMIDLGIANVISYNAALHAWARSGTPDAGEQAERLLNSMCDGVQPDARTFATVMDAWSRSYGCEDSAQRAHDLLTEMEELVRKGDVRMNPNYVVYSTVIKAYAMSKSEPLKAHKAFLLLQHMEELATKHNNPRIRPNRVTYNTVLNACATSIPNLFKAKVQEEGLDLPTLPDMVRKLYGQLLSSQDESRQPDHYTYGTVLKAVANVFWGDQNEVEFCKQIFKEACERGYVSFAVLVALRQAAPADVFRSLIPREAYNQKSGHVLMQHIPEEWTRKVRDESRLRRTSKNSLGMPIAKK